MTFEDRSNLKLYYCKKYYFTVYKINPYPAFEQVNLVKPVTVIFLYTCWTSTALFPAPITNDGTFKGSMLVIPSSFKGLDNCVIASVIALNKQSLKSLFDLSHDLNVGAVTKNKSLNSLNNLNLKSVISEPFFCDHFED